MKTPMMALICLSPLAVWAQSGSSTQIYGVLDAGVVSEHNCQGACPSTKLSPGVSTGSVLGVTGREPLNGDTAAIYRLEAGVRNDTGQSDENRLFGSQAYVGLDSRWGVLTLGRQYNLQYEALVNVADPFNGGTAGTATNLIGNGYKRYDNSIKYQSRPFHGVTGSAIYSFGESTFSSSRNRGYGAMIGYAGGMFNLRIAYQRKNNLIEAAGATAPVDLSARNTLVAANANLGPATVFAAYGINRGIGSSPWDQNNPIGALVLSSPSTRSHDQLVGISVPRGAATFMVSYIRKNDRTPANLDANQLAVGMTYALSRRTALYAAYAKIRSENGAPYTVGNFSEAGRGRSGINLGLRHAF
ncbi:porin [Massilia endophytica]|uniref:porin n=1 Tax=Massilia endophytica TaxID=2899220 RepID=UPI001E49C3ED|nr:porin [Massilia endophytica]UGQ47840.1 porin [Massilia endophytica]